MVNEKLSGIYDILADLSNNDVFGSMSISNTQSLDSSALLSTLNYYNDRPDLINTEDLNSYGYLLFANPRPNWSSGCYYNYYPKNTIIYSKVLSTIF